MMAEQSTIKRAFLDRMYHRLSEAKDGRSAARSQAERETWESIVAAISCSIDDYLRIHAPAETGK